mmetsp:Transcript_136343/g.265218  ORF Transcript_136343/g.265218 Transcript_136343/m.265218 type:complete len:165 (+) Transcript_136343:71-565(+)|eukprot:CAMPEP_0172689552 /NCGR_PEP_ID=MMETSP1074-20121228/23233_1 /TAXON_ID=2916 /ORGANISM="Ceratium fusus, Strain PA161109" /LENGTH=164 /DNA_ID=CAMNT_0013509377 /DNA_START=59 /DNA_END=553 /DNA_ORIENTATION=-
MAQRMAITVLLGVMFAKPALASNGVFVGVTVHVNLRHNSQIGIAAIKARATTAAAAEAAAAAATTSAAPASSRTQSSSRIDPYTGTSKIIKRMPPEGYNEYRPKQAVAKKHLGSKYVADWGNEWPQAKESQAKSIERICKDNSDHLWCKLRQRQEYIRRAANSK